MDHADYTSFAPASPLASGTPAPDFTLHSTPDQGVSLRDFRGRPVILVFWSYVSPIGVNPGADGILTALEDLSKQEASR